MSGGTLGEELERMRLHHRAARLELVLGALRGRAAYRNAEGRPPAALLDAIAGFSAELRKVEQSLGSRELNPIRLARSA